MQRKSRLTLVMMAILLMVGMVGIQPAKPVQAALPTDLFFSEYIEGGGQNKAIEIYNGTGLPVNLSDYRLELYSNGASAPTANAVLSGTLVTGDVFVVSRSDADPAIVAQADLLNSTVVSWNGDDAIALRKISTGLLVDAFGQIGYRPASGYWGTNPIVTADRTLVRKANICAGDPDGSNAFDPATEWDMYPKDTVSYIGSHTSNCAPEPPVINEFSASTAGTDVEFVEFFGSPNTDYSTYTLLGIEGDFNATNSSEGSVDNIIALGTTDASGFLLVSVAANVFENGTLSFLLVKDSTATTGVDIDTDDDGVIDVTYWSEIRDGVAVNDGGAGDLTYATPVLGVAYDGLSFAPGGASRIPDGTDTDTTADWVRNDFDLAGIPGFAGTIATGEAYNTPGATNRAYVETAPSVVSTIPANGGNHPIDENITITFSEKVTVTDPWFSISCASSGTHTAIVNDLDPVYVLNPDVDFTVGETCTVTITAASVVDDDADDATFNAMLADYSFSFTAVTPPERCGDPFTHTYDIQGTGETSPLAGTALATEGVVVGDFQVGGKNGYYIQDVTGDGDTATSDGIFVYNTTTAVNPGDHVRVRGTAVEYLGITEISPVTQVWVCSTGNTIAPTPVTLPVTAVNDFEKYESMLVTFPQSLIISEYFNYDRYGEIVLTSGRHMTPTAIVEPGAPAQAEAAAYLLDRITLDDGRTNQNPDPAIHPNGAVFNMTNLFRGGGTVTNVTGILDFYQSLYRVQPTTGAVYADVNARTAAPDITEADLKVTSFNVLNYFVTLDDGTHDICGPDGIQECRGADDSIEFDRQKAKIVAALATIDADVYGLMEIENDSPVAGNDAVADLVAGLNLVAGAGTYDYIVTGAIGGDAIKQAILYKPAAVTPVGTYKILDSTVDPRFIDTANRPVLAQAFASVDGGNSFVVAVNHLKSKGSACVGDPDLGDGAGNCNLTRKAAAEALVDWLANPAYFPDVEKTLIIGDLNSYDKEDPIDMIKLGADNAADTADDYLDMIFEKRGDYAYGYVYDGQSGYLDHALANLSLAENVVDVNFWHINADEPDLIDYDTSFKAPAQDALYAPDAYRSSDHDPVILTLDVLTLEEQITAAVSYVYTPVYNYVGLIAFDDPSNIFTGTYTDAQFAAGGPMNDLARYLGALYRQNDSSIDSIVFDGVTYTWNPGGTKKGSNWEDNSGNSLVSALVNYFFSVDYDPAVGLQITVSDEVATSTVTFMLINEYAALTWLQAHTVLSSVSGTVADLTATFPASIPPVIVAEPYTINSRFTLATELPAGTIVTVVRDGVEVFSGQLPAGLTSFLYTDLVGGTPAAFDAGYGGAVELYEITVTGPGGNPLAFATTVFVESVISKDGFTTETVLDDITLAVNIPADELAALEWLQAHTVLSSVSGTVADLTATFPASIPPVIVAEPYTINSRFTLATELPAGTIVTVVRDGVEVFSGQLPAGLTSFLYTDLVGGTPAAFDANYGGAVELYEITVTGPGNNPLDFDTTVFVESVISKDGFATETVLDDITLGVHIDDAVAPTIESGMAKSASHGDVALVDGTFTVDQGFVVDGIEITMDEPVLVDLGTIVAMEGYGPYGTITANVDGVITITPYAGNEIAALIGTFTFTLPDGSITDLRGNEFVGSITLEVLNVAPLAVDDAYTTDEDIALTVPARGVLVNDTDFDPTILTAVLVAEPTNGSVVLNADGSFTYTPEADFNGTDTFTYMANDGHDNSNVATVTITVTNLKDQVQAVDDEYATDEDTTITVAAPGVLANDIDVDGNEQAASLVTDVLHGSLSLLGDGSFTYTPDPDFVGTDSFVYKLITYPAPQSLWTDTATVTITVNPINDAPVLGLIPDATIPELVEFSFAATATDVDLPAQALTFTLVGAPTGAAITEDGVFTWTPTEAQGAGVYTFTVKVCDDALPALCDEQEVTLTVTEVNVAPVADDLTATTPEETPVDVTLVATDAENDPLTYSIVDQPTHGSVTLVGNVATYTPELNFFGADSFTFTANDGALDSNMAVVTITVTPVNDAPVAVADAYTTDEDTVLTVPAPGILENDFDVDGDELSITLMLDVTNGALLLNQDGSFTYTPDAEFNGTDTFKYMLFDGDSYSYSVVVSITVNSVNDWVVANDDEYETPAGVTLEIAAPGVLENDVLLDPDETVTLEVLVQPVGGTVTLNVDGSFTYVPNAGFFGVDTFEYQLNSTLMLQGEFSDTAIVTIKVTARQLFLPLILR